MNRVRLVLIPAVLLTCLFLSLWLLRQPETTQPGSHVVTGVSVAGSEEHASQTTPLPDVTAKKHSGAESPSETSQPNPPQPGSQSGIVIDGVVVATDGEPAEAHILLVDMSLNPDIATADACDLCRRALSSDQRDGQKRQASSTSGHFAFRDLPPDRSWTIVAYASEHGLSTLRNFPASIDTTCELSLESQGEAVFGEVLSQAGEPIAHALISVTSNRTITTVRSRDDGTFTTLPCCPPGSRVTCQAPGYQVSHRTMPQSPTKQTFVLTAARAISGPIVDTKGLSANLRTLFSSHPPDDPSTEGERLYLRTTPTAPAEGAGGYHHRVGRVDIEDDRYDLSLQSAGDRFVSLWFEEVLLGQLLVDTDEDELPMVIDVDRLAAELHEQHVFSVLVREQGKPYEGSYRIEMQSADSGPLHIPTADYWSEATVSTPRWSSGALSGHWYRVSVHANGLASGDRCVNVRSSRMPVVIDLEAARPPLEGFLFDPSGDPVAAATVALYDSRGAPTCSAWLTQTNLDGGFKFDGVPMSAEVFAIVADSIDFAPATQSIDQWVNPLRLTLQEGTPVTIKPTGVAAEPYTLQVLDSSGTPLHDSRRSNAIYIGQRKLVLPKHGDMVVVLENKSVSLRESIVPDALRSGELILSPPRKK